jgi:hypothetical protein
MMRAPVVHAPVTQELTARAPTKQTLRGASMSAH